MDIEELENRFAYHPPTTEERKRAHEQVRELCLNLAIDLNGLMPASRPREAVLVVTHLEEVMFWANAAIARQPETAAAQTGATVG